GIGGATALPDDLLKTAPRGGTSDHPASDRINCELRPRVADDVIERKKEGDGRVDADGNSAAQREDIVKNVLRTRRSRRRVNRIVACRMHSALLATRRAGRFISWRRAHR